MKSFIERYPQVLGILGTLLLIWAVCGFPAFWRSKPKFSKAGPDPLYPNPYGFRQRIGYPGRAEEAGPSHTDYKPGPHNCMVCGGSGKKVCGTCGGEGYTKHNTYTKDADIIRSPCGVCGGSGKVNCFACGGSGKEKQMRARALRQTI